jgi:AraC family transcriptional regulator of adaptative response/methylated-DNA-[protein]-cysteine methyltransferase
MERAYLQKDPAYEGLFFLGVRTTGIFCRPTCPARKPLPGNVEYFPDPRSAVIAGYRPCKRCRPLDQDDQPPWAAALIEEIEHDPLARIRDGDLRARGIDPATARRHFLKRYGMTFQAYARARRLTGVFSRIREGGSVDDAVYDSGYESHSGFREAFARMFGETPGRARGRGCVMLSWLPSPLGPLVAGATEEGVCLLEFTERRMLEAQFAELKKRFGSAVVPGTNACLESLREQLGRYFEGSLRAFSLPLRFPGSPFEEKVWRALLEIPYGETRSYKDLAAAIGEPAAVRAVGRANGRNRISIVIPCHRVVNADGGLGGYGGGLHRKRCLLDLERGARRLAM